VSFAVPAPPADLPEPNRAVLPTGSMLHRVHLSDFAGASFNPCRGRPTRFAPIRRADGACVPSLYAGSSLDAAIFETVFHDIPAQARLKSVPKQDVLARSHSILVTVRDQALVELRTPDLKKWGLDRHELVSAPAAHYDRTARWAEAIHRRFDDVDGLVWTSNQCDPADAMLFFGDRVDNAGFTVVSTRRGAQDDSFLADVREAGLRAGIVITL
jgi:hypothetical protein